ncbi:hypothetical protein [Rhodobium gokarnense]|uniref:Uncharacterized protein n=1 Tax=Rhodobium gokarnense TaxID=364296 RepID=A0ABT3HE97_9HYPH|nr:hypothetical protein [Rhodobium gokarnense]MCW2308730.1 hypothetical protein [Rhodobium gokarnense]
MGRQLPGPHHCVTLGISEALNVFKFLKEESESDANIGKIDLDALMQKYLVKMSREMGRYYESNARCYASIETDYPIFNPRKLAHSLLTEHLRQPILSSFKLQTQDASKSWITFFVHGLMNFATHEIGTDLPAAVAKRYNTLAFTNSQNITIETCLHDEGISTILAAFVKKFRPVLINEEILDRLTKFLNKEMDERFESRGPSRLHVNNKEVTIFFTKAIG